MRALVYGLAVTGASTVRALHRRGVDVVVADDAVDAAKAALADELGVELVDPATIDPAAIDNVLASVDLVSPAPGVPGYGAYTGRCPRASIINRADRSTAVPRGRGGQARGAW